MNVMPAMNPYAPRPPQNSPALMREVARRRWMAEQRQERQLSEKRNASNANKVVDRVAQIRRLRPGRAAASSLSPVYNMFSEAILRAR